MPGLLDIGEVARRSGMPPSTLRFYERELIIESTDRRGLRRQYPVGVLDTLAVVAMCRGAGFSLAEIRALLATGGDAAWKHVAMAKRDDLGCPSPNVFDCEHFRAALHHALPVVHATGAHDDAI
jgi:DNA-binding transcriptional MerR regulator